MCQAVAVAALVAALSGCGNSDSFHIEGTIEGAPTMNLRVAYYGDGALKMGVTAVLDGKFKYDGASSEPTLVEIMDNDYRTLAWLYAANGDELECTLRRNNPYAVTVSGSDDAARFAQALSDNAEALQGASWQRRNSVISSYVAGHSDDVVSTLMLITAYDSAHDPYGADSLMAVIAAEARPAALVSGYSYLLGSVVGARDARRVLPIHYVARADSMATFDPSRQRYALLALSDKECGRPDSIVPALRRLARRMSRGRFAIVDFTLDADTSMWHRTVRTDSATWRQGWCAAALASPGIDRLAVPSLPYFVVVDSAGCRLFGTPSVTAAERYLNDKIIPDIK